MMGFGHGSGISWTICKQSAPCSRQIITPTPHHSIFTGQMLFLTPNHWRPFLITAFPTNVKQLLFEMHICCIQFLVITQCSPTEWSIKSVTSCRIWLNAWYWQRLNLLTWALGDPRLHPPTPPMMLLLQSTDYLACSLFIRFRCL